MIELLGHFCLHFSYQNHIDCFGSFLKLFKQILDTQDRKLYTFVLIL